MKQKKSSIEHPVNYYGYAIFDEPSALFPMLLPHLVSLSQKSECYEFSKSPSFSVAKSNHCR
ncbi:uncharacterized protein DS421_3g82480 [Arachis hypogaea]|nr:uncharacterized protein DS421_3g82480 [Arachis hypogaea]